MKDGGRGKIKIVVAGYCAVLLWSAVWSGACGSTAATGGGDSDSSGDGSTLQVTGTVQVPTITTSSSLSKSMGSKAVSDAVAAGLTCNLYILDGTKVGSATSGSDGTFTITATLSTLKGSAIGTTWTKTVQSVCVDTTDAIEVRSYQELTVVEGTTTTVSMGTIDTTTTLAAASAELAHQDSSGTVGCDPSTGQSCSVVSSATDVSCLFAADKTIWKLGSTSGSGAVDDLGWLLSAVRAAQAGGVTPSTLGETNWGAVIRKMRRNELSAAQITQLATATATALGSDVDDLSTFLSSATALSSSIRTVLTDTLAGSAGAVTVGTSTPCALGEADTNYMQALVTPLMGADNASDIATVYGDAASWEAWAETLDKVTDASYTRFIGHYIGLNAFLEERKTDDTLSTWDAEDSVLLYNMLALDFFEEAAATAAAEADYFTGWANVDAGTCVFSGVWDAVRGDYVDSVFQTDSYDADTYNYSELATTLTEETFSSTAGTTCEAYTDSDVQRSCYDTAIGALPITENFTEATSNAFAGWAVENSSLAALSISDGVLSIAVDATTVVESDAAATRWRFSTSRNENGIVMEVKLTAASGLSQVDDGVSIFVADGDAKAECSLERDTSSIVVRRNISGGTGGGTATTIGSSVDTSVNTVYLPLVFRLTLNTARNTVTCSYSSAGATTLTDGGSVTFTDALDSSYTAGFELENATGDLPLHLGVDYMTISEP